MKVVEDPCECITKFDKRVGDLRERGEKIKRNRR